MKTCIGLWNTVIFEIPKQSENLPQTTVKLVDLFLTECRATLSGIWP